MRVALSRSGQISRTEGVGRGTPVIQRVIQRRNSLRNEPHRRGLATLELILVLPLLLGLVLAAVEFGMIWSASQRVQMACATACRVGTRPCENLTVLNNQVQLAAQTSLISQALVQSYSLNFFPGANTGDPVIVELKVPMSAAAPDLLQMFGFSLKKRFLYSRIIMRKE
jgi:hypothetical protein